MYQLLEFDPSILVFDAFSVVEYSKEPFTSILEINENGTKKGLLYGQSDVKLHNTHLFFLNGKLHNTHLNQYSLQLSVVFAKMINNIYQIDTL